MLKKGDRGAPVEALQRQLAAAGFDPGAVDGILGPRTLDAAHRAQSARGLPRTGDVIPDRLLGLLGSPWGVDISYVQGGRVDAAKLKAGGCAFVYVKASEGYHADPFFAGFRSAVRAAGITQGDYLFFHPGLDPRREAATFAAVVGRLGAGDLPPVLDIEADDALPPDHVLGPALICLEEIERLTGARPLVYTSPSYGGYHHLSPLGATYPLWLANYQTSAPRLPAGWERWVFWQTGTARVAGVEGEVDLDLFGGTAEELKALAKA